MISEIRSFETVHKILESLNVFPKVASVLPYDKPTEKFSPKYVTAFTIIQEPNQHIGEAFWKKFVSEGLENGKLTWIRGPPEGPGYSKEGSFGKESGC
ncbi:hypothetical protein BOTCAL_0155g00150 [Botryotinia calthae]|uniref:Uncharacterized protein n=1 Tax=Botryotinia calthae TaxID=38488 RepID=A0A4Y8D263_9HELO|nr:hypothetical protein BOTCAL_0155g00150 [Botryotinia calthae]